MDNYIPSDEALKFIAFLRATGNEENNSPEVHYKIADALFSKNKIDWKVVIECTRGMGKSTTLEYAVIYVAVLGEWPNFGKCPFMVFLGATNEGNVRAFFKNVASKIENSDFLRGLLKINRQVDNEIEMVNQDGVETIVTGRGMNTNWRGIRSKRGDRPYALLADDVLPSEIMTSEALRNTVEMNWFNSALPALNPAKHKIIYIGTPLTEDDLLHKLKNSGTYRIERYPLCSKFPCTREEFDSVWPDRFSFEYTNDMYKQFAAAGKTQSFYTEYMLDITDLSTLLVDEDDVKWFDPSTVRKNKDGYNFYITTDFATSTKKSADYSTIGVWAINNNSDWMLVDGQAKRQTMQDNINDVFDYVRKWKPLSVGIETSGQQGGFLSIIDEEMQRRNVYFSLAKKQGSKEPGIRPAKDKVHRFVTGVQPRFKQGKIWLPKPEVCKATNLNLLGLVEELVHELSRFTLAGGVKALAHDDCGTYDVQVDTPTGSKLLGELKDGDEVIGFGARGSAVCKVKEHRITGIKPIVNMELDSGDILKFSEFHPVLVENKYKLVRDLVIGDKLTRNLEWKNQLSLTELSGHKNQVGTTNQQPELMMAVEKTGFINMCMKRSLEEFLKVMRSITKMKTNVTMTSQILNYCQANNINLNIKSRMLLMGINLQVTWQQTLMKFKSLLRRVKPESTLERIKGKSNPINQLNVLVAGMSLHPIERHVRILNSAVVLVETSGTTDMLKSVSVRSVEQYSNLVLEALDTVVMTAEVLTLKEQLKESLSTYVACAEKHSQELQDRLAVEKNAQEIGKMNLNGCTDKIKRIWVTKPEPTYNFEVDQYHNYQVHNGIVVHNCIDLLNQLSEMELYAPSDAVDDEYFTNHNKSSIWADWVPDDNKYGENGSTVF